MVKQYISCRSASDTPRSCTASCAYLRSEVGLRYGRLFVAVNGQSLYGEPAFAEALRDSVRRRVEDPAAATSMVSRLRGLLTDLLLTGDDERVDAAFAMLPRDADRLTGRPSRHRRERRTVAQPETANSGVRISVPRDPDTGVAMPSGTAAAPRPTNDAPGSHP